MLLIGAITSAAQGARNYDPAARDQGKGGMDFGL